MGFFDDDEVESGDPRALVVPQCGACGLYAGCKSPYMPVTGKGHRGVLIVAEAPGRNEDERGVQLIGKAGKELRSQLDLLGVDLDGDCWKTNAVICRPEDNKLPPKAIEYCRPNLNKTLDELQPKVVVLLGAPAVESLLGPEWGSSIGKLGRWVGWRIPLQSRNMWICPTYHPSYILREGFKPLTTWFRNHLEAAFELDGRPWKEVPDYKSKVRIEKDPKTAARLIRLMASKHPEVPIAFDYETDRMKPDHPEASIYSCSICWGGDHTLAYPWVGEAIEATSEVLRSPVRKIGANIKFEQRWTIAKLGHRVRNWWWDCMQAAHICDCREGITSVKFQGFVRLGFPYWAGKIDSFLREKSGNKQNRIRQANLNDLLLYNGLDSITEYHIAMSQRKELGL